MKNKIFLAIVLMLVTTTATVTAVDIADLEYLDEKIIYLQGDRNLVFEDVDYNGTETDLTLLRLGYDNDTNITFYNIESNNIHSQIIPGFENTTKTYTYLDGTKTYTVTVDYSCITVPVDPDTQIRILELMVENLSTQVDMLTLHKNNLTMQLENETRDKQNLSEQLTETNTKLTNMETQLDLANNQLSYMENIVDPLKQMIRDNNNTIDNLTTIKMDLTDENEILETKLDRQDITLDSLTDPWCMSYVTFDSQPGFYAKANNHFYLNYPSLLIGSISVLFLVGVVLYKTGKIQSELLNSLFSKITKKQHKELKSRKSSIDTKLEAIGKEQLLKQKQRATEETTVTKKEENKTGTADFFNNLDKQYHTTDNKYRIAEIEQTIDKLPMYQ